MRLFPTLLALCLFMAHGASLPATNSFNDSLGYVNDFVDTINFAGKLILDRRHEAILKTKCQNNGGDKAFQLAKNAGFEFTQCVQKIVNVAVLRKEIAEGKKTSNLDEVFPKYCQRKNEFKHCFDAFMRTSQICLDEKELEQRETINKIFNKFLHFVCFKDGDRIALFIADKGPQCIEKHLETIYECVNTAFGISTSIPVNPFAENPVMPDIKEVPSLLFDEKSCRKMTELQRCTVSAVMKCDEPTVANLLQAGFSHIRKSTPCKLL